MQDTVDALRAFNRFHASLTGGLETRFLGTELTMPQARVLFEAATRGGPSARALSDALALDPGYLSRLLGQLEERGLVARPRDGRTRPVVLTSAGEAVFAQIDSTARSRGEAMVERLGENGRAHLVAALASVRALLAGDDLPPATIRTFLPGDLALLASRQAIFYHERFNWGRPLETLLGETVTAFLRDFRPGREQGWIAESAGRFAGDVLLTEEEAGVARLRLMFVEPWAHGQGLGRRLLETLLGFAREAGYRAVVLWTHSVLEDARRLYVDAGFRCVDRGLHHHFGEPVEGETWRLEL